MEELEAERKGGAGKEMRRRRRRRDFAFKDGESKMRSEKGKKGERGGGEHHSSAARVAATGSHFFQKEEGSLLFFGSKARRIQKVKGDGKVQHGIRVLRRQWNARDG